MKVRLTRSRIAQGATLLMMLTMAVFAAAQIETIDAIVRGTSTQMGKQFNVKVSFDRFSTPAEKQALKAAFDKGGHDGLVKALEKMKPVGRLRLPSTTGYTIAYAVSIPTPTGHKVRFITGKVDGCFRDLRRKSRSPGRNGLS